MLYLLRQLGKLMRMHLSSILRVRKETSHYQVILGLPNEQELASARGDARENSTVLQVIRVDRHRFTGQMPQIALETEIQYRFAIRTT